LFDSTYSHALNLGMPCGRAQEPQKKPAEAAKKVAPPAAARPKPVAAIFNADEEEDAKEREKAMRKKMKLERIDYGEHALDADKKAAAQTAKSIIDQIPTDTDQLFAFDVNWDCLDKAPTRPPTHPLTLPPTHPITHARPCESGC
jgi:hypothetical protein